MSLGQRPGLLRSLFSEISDWWFFHFHSNCMIMWLIIKCKQKDVHDSVWREGVTYFPFLFFFCPLCCIRTFVLFPSDHYYYPVCLDEWVYVYLFLENLFCLFLFRLIVFISMCSSRQMQRSTLQPSFPLACSDLTSNGRLSCSIRPTFISKIFF